MYCYIPSIFGLFSPYELLISRQFSGVILLLIWIHPVGEKVDPDHDQPICYSCSVCIRS